MPSGDGPGVGTGRELRALCKLSSIPSIKSGISDKNCASGPGTAVAVGDGHGPWFAKSRSSS